MGITSYFLSSTTDYKPIIMLSAVIEVPESDSEVLSSGSNFCTYNDEKIYIYAHNTSDTEKAEDFNKVVKSIQEDCKEVNIEGIMVNKTNNNYSYLYIDIDKHLEIFVFSTDAKVVAHSIKTLEIVDYKLTTGNSNDKTVLMKVINNTSNNLTDNNTINEEIEEDNNQENLNQTLFSLPIYLQV